MKSTTTMLKAASVMLATIIIGTSCQKNVEAAPEQQLKDQSASSVEGEKMTYTMVDHKGKPIGELHLSDDRGYARAELVLASTVARNADVLTAVMLTREGEKYAVLKAFSYQSDGYTLGLGQYVSATSPVMDVHGKTPLFREFWQAVQGYSVLTYDETGQKLAMGSIR